MTSTEPHGSSALRRRTSESPQAEEMAAGVIEALDSYRQAASMTKADLARLLNKKPSAVRRVLSKNGNPELLTLALIASAMGLTIDLVPKPSSNSAGDTDGSTNLFRGEIEL